MKKIGALETGGTKMVLAVYSEAGEELNRLTLPTEDPSVTLPAMGNYFAQNHIDALGIASFGPLDLNPSSPTYGFITTSPKLAWRNTPLLPTLSTKLHIPVQIDTDVNAAALAEAKLGAAAGCGDLVYITVGTGIGGGLIIDGKPVHGILHPEMGHILLQPCPNDPMPQGICPSHKGCLEGLASGTALGARCKNGNAADLPDDDPLLDLEAHYLAQLCHTLVLVLSPEKIILGGGVMKRSSLLPKIHRETQRLLNGYIQVRQITEKIEDYIISPKLYPVSGLVGAYLLGKQALEGQ